MIILDILTAWFAFGAWLIVTGRTGCDIIGNAPWWAPAFATISTLVIGPPLWLAVIVTGKDI